ncbi:IclR family transcriptional regulator [uncultured Roseobacter sp.]|uniref:IclR family transcriptional regulator n=1 Tax=uncultured Roseobacter sp. TaxID=114847 RepID=UPI00261EA1A3|nr:IclR family transcriptional regulator [uncultured Roseobacter sp.]
MKTEEIESGRSGIQVISRAATILRSLKEHPEGLSLGQIASEVGLPRSTVQRIAGALQTERLLISNASGGGVRLGPELGALAQAARHDTAERCRALLSDLTQATGETSDLSVLRGDKMIFIDQVPGTHRLRTVSSVGEVFPITTTANGRACLAKLPRDVALKRASAEAGRNGIDLDLNEFGRLLDHVAQTGLAYDNNEHSDGISAVGFAFEDWTGELHAISVPVPTTRFLRQQPEIEAAVRRSASAVEKVMQGGRGR